MKQYKKTAKQMKQYKKLHSKWNNIFKKIAKQIKQYIKNYKANEIIF